MLWIALIVSASIGFILRCCPDTPLAKVLRTHLIELPVARASQMSRSDLIYFMMFAALLAVGGEVLVMVFGPGFALLYAADLSLYASLYVDVLMVTAMAASRIRLAMTVQSIRSFSTKLALRRRLSWRATVPERVARSKSRAKSADNDSDGSGDEIRIAA